MHGRPSCVECTDALRQKRGCFKPGFSVEGSDSLFRFTSPMLQEIEGASELRECPVGAILRDAPWVYDVINAYKADGHGLEILSMPVRLQRMMAVIGSETGRLRELVEKRQKAKADAAHGASVLKGRKRR